MANKQTLEVVYNKFKEEECMNESINDMNLIFLELTEIKKSIEVSIDNTPSGLINEV